jgi:hypothetical protein
MSRYGCVEAVGMSRYGCVKVVGMSGRGYVKVVGVSRCGYVEVWVCQGCGYVGAWICRGVGYKRPQGAQRHKAVVYTSFGDLQGKCVDDGFTPWRPLWALVSVTL